MVVKDLEGRYLRVNREWEQVWGIPSRTALGKISDQLFSSVLNDKFPKKNTNMQKRFTIRMDRTDKIAFQAFFFSKGFPLIGL